MQAKAKLALVLATSCTSLQSLDPSKPCNGDPGLCHLRVDQVTFGGMHNADSTHLKLKGKVNVACATDNHEHYIARELEAGLRYMDIDTCLVGEAIEVCHGPAMGRGLLPELRAVKEWMDRHPREVIAISFVNAEPGTGGEPAKLKMMELITSGLNDTFKGMALLADLEPPGNRVRSWPTLGEMVERNVRVWTAWGPRLYKQIYEKNKVTPGFRIKHIRFETVFQNTYDSSYHTMHPPELKDYLEEYCEKPKGQSTFKHNQKLILADAYLTATPKRLSWSYCIKDLAADVNPILLEDTELATNPLITMQANCWKNKRHVNLVGMDYVEYFPQHLTTIVRAMNTRNFAHFGWIGAVARVTGESDTGKIEELLAGLAGLSGSAAARIKVDAKEASVASRRLSAPERALAPGSLVKFSIHAPPAGEVHDKPSNAEVLARMRRGASPAVDGIRAVCRDPGVPDRATRSPAAISGEGFEEGAVLSFTCNQGLVAHGHTSRTCGDTGIFSGIQPRCLEQWTKQVRLMPLWLKILLIVLTAVCLLACIGGCIYLCCKRCRKKDYEKLDQGS